LDLLMHRSTTLVSFLLLFALSGCASGPASLNDLIYGGKSIEAQEQIRSGANVNLRSDSGWTPLMFAAQAGDLATAQLLIARGADVNARANNGTTALIVAAGHRSVPVISLLLDNGANVNDQRHDGFSALMLSAQANDVAMVRLLMKRGADIHAQNRFGVTALGVAATNAKDAVAFMLIDSGARVDVMSTEGMSILMFAAEGGSATLIQRLVGAGAAVNERDRFLATPLYHASHAGHTAAVSALLQGGADARLTNTKGTTPLMAAAFLGHFDIVAQLSNYSDINALDVNGGNAIYSASVGGRTNIVAFLLDRGADFEHANHKGYRAINGAVAQYSSRPTAYLLIQAGAKPHAVPNDLPTTVETYRAYAEYYGFLGRISEVTSHYGRAMGVLMRGTIDEGARGIDKVYQGARNIEELVGMFPKIGVHAGGKPPLPSDRQAMFNQIQSELLCYQRSLQREHINACLKSLGRGYHPWLYDNATPVRRRS
jgi:uncharacterized protein